MIRHAILATAALITMGAAAAQPVPTGPVRLLSQPHTALDATARRIAAADVEDGGSGALLLLGQQRLGTAGSGPALFVQVQSERACGSAGCSTSVYLPERTGYTKVLDAVSGAVVVAPAQHGGMHDLLVGRDDRWTWNGRTYVDTLPAPQVDLRPHRRPAPRTTRTPSRANP